MSNNLTINYTFIFIILIILIINNFLYYKLVSKWVTTLPTIITKIDYKSKSFLVINQI